MGRRWHSRFWRLLLAPISVLTIPLAARTQELPLERCDALPVVQVRVRGAERLFLIDTAATSMLNRESFAGGASRDINVTSWSGTQETNGKEITIQDLEVGRTRVVKIALPAIDLSAIGKACGRKIDGVLGADLLAKIGATVDLKREILHVVTTDELREAE